MLRRKSSCVQLKWIFIGWSSCLAFSKASFKSGPKNNQSLHLSNFNYSHFFLLQHYHWSTGPTSSVIEWEILISKEFGIKKRRIDRDNDVSGRVPSLVTLPERSKYMYMYTYMYSVHCSFPLIMSQDLVMDVSEGGGAFLNFCIEENTITCNERSLLK